MQLSEDKLTELTDRAANEVKMALTTWRNSPDTQKRAQLLSYWLIDYLNYIKNEKTFVPASLKEYSRGDIIKANFGFNIGSEHGGLHYAIVLDNSNARNSPILTVVPLSSAKPGKNIHQYNLSLGSEIYEKLKVKLDTETGRLNSELNAAMDELRSIVTMEKMHEQLIAEISDDKRSELQPLVDALYQTTTEKQESLNTKVEDLKKERNSLQDLSKEISKMKQGSIALVNQITTISKQKIYDPRSDFDPLAGIKLSTQNLEALNDKIKQLFLR